MADAEYTRDQNLQLVWNTLMFFACESSYTMGERTGGVLQGCPRKPPPSPDELAGYAQIALAALCRFVGREPEDWMLAALPSASIGEQREQLLVPMKPTTEMVEAGAMRIAMNAQYVCTAESKAEAVWRAMLATSPASKGAGGGGEDDRAKRCEAMCTRFGNAPQCLDCPRLESAPNGPLGTSPDQQKGGA
jgi:hypothetical protein